MHLIVPISKKKNTIPIWIGVNIVFVRPTFDDMPTRLNNSGIGLLTTLRMDIV